MSLSSSLGRRLRRCTAALAVLATASWLTAQGLPYVAPELHSNIRPLRGDTITICTWPGISSTAAVDRAVAEAIGMVMLLAVDVYEYPFPGVMSSDEFLQLVLIQLGESCDAVAGFQLVPDGFPEWLQPTRAYLRLPYQVLVQQGGPASLGDVPAGSRIGSQVYTEGDVRLLAYLQSAGGSPVWRRFPYDAVATMARHVASGTVAAGIAWQPAIAAEADLIASLGLAVVAPAPIPLGHSGVGFALRNDNTFLRAALDAAIEILEQEGVLEEIATEHGLTHLPGD